MGLVSEVWLSVRLPTLWPLLQPHSIRSAPAVSWGAQRCLQPLCSMHRPRHPLASWRHVSGRGFPVCLSRTHFTLHSLRSTYSWPPLHPFPLKEPQPLCVSASNTGAITQACILGRIPDSTMICPLPIASTSFLPMLKQKPFSKARSFHCWGMDRGRDQVPALPLTSGLTLGKSQIPLSLIFLICMWR